MADKPMPKLTWKHTDADGKAVLAVESDLKPKAVRYWVADADTRDFRRSKWREQSGNTTAYPEKGFRAVLAEAEYEIDGLPFTLCTQLRILEAKK
jgi:hypothetical protein